MSRFEPIYRDALLSAIDVKYEILGMSFQHLIGSIIGSLEWLADCIVVHEDVAA